MTPNQIATNFALIAMADMEDKAQARAAVKVMMRTIPALRDHLLGQFETASCSQETIFNGFRDYFQSTLLAAGVTDVTEEVSDDEILLDDVSDEEEENEEDQPIIESASFNDSVNRLRELAMGELKIRDKGKYIPLDDIEMPEAEVKKSVKDKPTAAAMRGPGAAMDPPKRRNVMGGLRK